MPVVAFSSLSLLSTMLPVAVVMLFSSATILKPMSPNDRKPERPQKNGLPPRASPVGLLSTINDPPSLSFASISWWALLFSGCPRSTRAHRVNPSTLLPLNSTASLFSLIFLLVTSHPLSRGRPTPLFVENKLKRYGSFRVSQLALLSIVTPPL